ncbi:MAG: hypothetical protein JWQ44_673 [Chthoniobacter sp.]|nr:hypothetical protein [Chthoniobacter sp.]
MIRSLLGGSLLMPGILHDLLTQDASAAITAADPLVPRAGHFPGKAKRVIFIYLSGGFSHVDTFDPKPSLISSQGKEIGPNKFLQAPKWEFKKRGKCGTEISELFPHIGEVADDLCVIRSMKGDHGNHFEATLGMHTGSFSFARPSIGSWVSYGLGTVNQNLPSFVVLAPQLPYAGGQVWSSDFLPGAHQGVRVVGGSEPIPNLNPSSQGDLQALELGLLQRFNRKHAQGPRASDSALNARIKSFETAYGMQREAPEAFDVSKETDATLALYGLQRGDTKGFGWQCLVARRLAERGVRFIELIDTGSNNNWDSHGNMQEHAKLAKNVDQPTAGLLKDLKSRGMLEDTLVVFTTEFGRTPFTDKPDAKGREHHAQVFSSWLAGAGVKGGITYGESDEHGVKVARDEVHVHDFHATILHLLGFNHEKLTFRHAGRDFRLTDVHGKVVKAILS